MYVPFAQYIDTTLRRVTGLLNSADSFKFETKAICYFPFINFPQIWAPADRTM